MLMFMLMLMLIYQIEALIIHARASSTHSRPVSKHTTRPVSRHTPTHNTASHPHTPMTPRSSVSRERERATRQAERASIMQPLGEYMTVWMNAD